MFGIIIPWSALNAHTPFLPTLLVMVMLIIPGVRDAGTVVADPNPLKPT